MKKILLAGLLGGLAMFIWESIAHIALPLGEAGIKGLEAHEAPMMAAFKEHIKEPGFYFFPAPEDKPGMTAAQKEKSMADSGVRMASEPTGILIVHPNGYPPNMGQRLPVQFAGDVLIMLIAAYLLSKAGALSGYGARVLFVTLMGLLPTLAIDMPEWNWYGFPDTYLAAQFLVHVVGFALGGLVLARLVK